MPKTKLRKWRETKDFSVSRCAQGARVARWTWARAEQGLALGLDVADRIIRFVSAHGGDVSYRDLVSDAEKKSRRL